MELAKTHLALLICLRAGSTHGLWSSIRYFASSLVATAGFSGYAVFQSSTVSASLLNCYQSVTKASAQSHKASSLVMARELVDGVFERLVCESVQGACLEFSPH
ncbi:hypothetical protein EV356DRAFT_390343 [Viridothelium virens]|uniref:Uncharacterized protein n=1 Tax=Viridothelium virens TaxID=1048519 RepID=A0A6A6GUE9_VIRVR|nr:hypothetical protein EV356DRAFT_390343 [Viridothelium virens]